MIDHNASKAGRTTTWERFPCTAGQPDEAVVAYRQSLRYRPNYVPTYLNLGYAFKDSDRLAEAAAVWEQAARLAHNTGTAARAEPAGAGFGLEGGSEYKGPERIYFSRSVGRSIRSVPFCLSPLPLFRFP